MRAIDKPDIPALVEDDAAIEQAMTRAVREAVLRHKRLAEPIVVWRDGQVVVPPEEIPEDPQLRT